VDEGSKRCSKTTRIVKESERVTKAESMGRTPPSFRYLRSLPSSRSYAPVQLFEEALKLGEPEAHLLGAYGIFLFLVIASEPAIAKAQVRINPVIARAEERGSIFIMTQGHGRGVPGCSDFVFVSVPEHVCQSAQTPAYPGRQGAITSSRPPLPHLRAPAPVYKVAGR